MRGGVDGNTSVTAPITKKDGSPCNTTQEILDRWSEHYEELLNHAPAPACHDLYTASSAAAQPDPDVPDDAPSLEDVSKAVHKLRNGISCRF